MRLGQSVGGGGGGCVRTPFARGVRGHLARRWAVARAEGAEKVLALSQQGCSTYKWVSKNNHPDAASSTSKRGPLWLVRFFLGLVHSVQGRSFCKPMLTCPNQRSKKKRTFLPRYERWPHTPAPSTLIGRLSPQFTACGSRGGWRGHRLERDTLSYLIQNARRPFCLGSGAPCWPSWSRVWA